MMTEPALDRLKAARKKANQKCRDKCQQLEAIADEMDDFDLESDDEEIVQWVRVTKNSIKIKDVNDRQP
jgi:hypothetical protein